MRDAIVVGSSAGGVRALRSLVGELPADLPAAVLVVNHIPAGSRSALPVILDEAGPLTAKPAEDGERLKHGTVYVAPPDRHLLVEKGRLRLTRGPRENRVRPCIDTLFRSAAVDLGPRVIGVVLSGTLDDGTAGLWAIKDRGGVAIVQRPTEAEYPDMPENAMKHVDVDHVLPAAEISAKLAELVRERTGSAMPVPEAMAAEAALELHGSALKEGVLSLGKASPNACPECHGSLIEINQGSITRYRCHTGHGFSLQTLMSETEVQIERSLWSAVRAIEERSFLLRSMEEDARETGNPELGERLAAAADRDEENAQGVRSLIVGSSSAR
ncbi:MAG TPA: chemotaxis protein CheB [Gammaproteobacteria bacterium]|nr:chemotaxis protein CheB [Gammaproteobacteria bacterium]